MLELEKRSVGFLDASFLATHHCGEQVRGDWPLYHIGPLPVSILQTLTPSLTLSNLVDLGFVFLKHPVSSG